MCRYTLTEPIQAVRVAAMLSAVGNNLERSFVIDGDVPTWFSEAMDDEDIKLSGNGYLVDTPESESHYVLAEAGDAIAIDKNGHLHVIDGDTFESCFCIVN